ncbi:MAG: J domain-containing protein, partial [Synechococcaceae cyanobacterium]|nr:J domain-containing protein [Synechococcaceae cyanobacterium]
RRSNPAAQRAKEMANRTGTASGKFYDDGQARTTMSLAQLRTAVRQNERAKGVKTRSAFLNSALAAGLTQTNAKGIAVGRMPKTRGDWERLYKGTIGIPQSNRGQRQRQGMVNGIDIHRDFRPWAVFGLNPKTANVQDVNQAFRRAARSVHPDTGGRSRDFARLQQMRDSILALMPKPKPAKGSSRRAATKPSTSTPRSGRPLALPPASTSERSSPRPRRRRR